jgi:hypothetical protein
LNGRIHTRDDSPKKQHSVQFVPVAATVGAVGIVVAAVLLQFTNWPNPLAAFRYFPHTFRVDVPDAL